MRIFRATNQDDKNLRDKILPYLFSGFLLICCLFFCSCSKKVNFAEDNDRAAYESKLRHMAVTNRLKAELPEILPCSRYLQNILIALEKHQNVSVYVGASDKDLAFSLNSDTIVLSNSLLQKLGDHDELAFILAHELAHIVLKHHNAVNNSADYNFELELEADQLALTLMQRAGFSPHAAIRVIKRTYISGHGEKHGLEMARKRRITKLSALINTTKVPSIILKSSGFSGRSDCFLAMQQF